MGSRNFVRASSNRIASGVTGWANGMTVNGTTLAAYCTVASLPGAGAYNTALSLTSATSARNLYIGLAGDGGNALSCVFGANQIDFGAGSGLVPTADGRWYLLVVTKATGTVAPIGYMYDIAANVMVTATAGATTANRSAAAVTANVGAGLGAADFWNGRLAYVAAFDRALTQGMITQLVHRNSWKHFHRSIDGLDVDLTWRNGVMGFDEKNPTINFSAGTQPALDGVNPPGFA